MDLLVASVTELVQRIRRREVSPVEVVDAHIARIAAVNPAINAVVAERFDEARREARQAEEALMSARDPGELPALLGVPCTIKEFISVAGMPQTAGLLSRRGRIAERDSTVVERLRQAGAIILGVTNVPEGGMWMETANKVYGRTNNPWNLRRTPGGSSGGEAAIVSAGGSAFGIGSDIAGSIRIPSAFCGVVGHKPTGRTVPNTGHWGPESHGTGPFLTCGPIARTVADLSLVLGVIRGPDGHDLIVEDRSPGVPAEVDLRQVAVYPLEGQGRLRIWEPMRAAVRRTAASLAARGAEIRELRSRRFDEALRVWAMAMNDAAAGDSLSFYDVLGEGQPFSPWAELCRATVGRSRFTLPALGLVVLERMAARLPRRLTAAVAKIRDVRAEIEAEIGERGVILHPPYTRSAPLHGGALLTPFDFICTAIFSVLEFPVTQVPTGFDPRGLPVGVQVAARRGNDHLTLAVAAAIEEDFGRWVMSRP